MTEQVLYNKEAEEIVIGSIFSDPALILELPNQPQHFSRQNAEIYKTLQEMDRAGVPLEPMALVDYLGENNLENIGGLGNLLNIAGGTPSTANVKYYATRVIDYFIQRQTIEVGRQLAAGLASEEGIRKLQNLQDEVAVKSKGSIKDATTTFYQRLVNPKVGYTGIASRYRDLDNMTQGFQRGEFTILAARPSVGKSALAVNLCINAAQSAKYPDSGTVAVFSMEMKDDKLVERMASNIAGIDSEKIRTGTLTQSDWKQMDEALDIIYNSDMHIFDDTDMNMQTIRSSCKELRRANPEGEFMIIIDYLQLIRPIPGQKTSNRQEEVSEISRALKRLAMEMDAPVIALSQITRGVESRQDKRPGLSDLRESGSLEQDADLVIFLYREDYYDKETEDKNMIELIIAKQRNGPTGTVKLAYIKEISKFVTIDFTGIEN